jgi:mono/diheme cytochrome c family protein
MIAWCSASLLLSGCRVSQPGRVETALMTWMKHRVTAGHRRVQNPLGHGAAIAREGQTAFAAYCVVCHGLDGQNTGVPFAGQISPPIPSLASKEVQEYSDGQLKWIIENGISPSGMPASRGILSEEEMWSIVEYLRHLPPAGSLGEPCVYTGDCGAAYEKSSEPSTEPSAGKRGAR